MLRPILIATLIAGTLDILSAFVFAGIAGMTPLAVLRFVASGPFGDAPTENAGWAAAGLLVHFTIMFCMVSAYMIISPRFPTLMRHPVPAGIAYGIGLWIIMYWIVWPIRFSDLPVPLTFYEISNQLFSHCVLVGVPIALVASRHFGSERRSATDPRRPHL